MTADVLLPRTMQVRLTDQQHALINKAASQHGMTCAEVVREAIDEALTKACAACRGAGRMGLTKSCKPCKGSGRVEN